MAFVHRTQVRFGECDPAGILYYPRYFDLFHRTMEVWFAEALGRPYAPFVRDAGLGVPAVHAEADYFAPAAYGDDLDITLRISSLGRTSIGFVYEVVGADGVRRAEGRVTTVLMDLDPNSPTFRRAVPLPDDFRAQLESYRAAC